MDINEQRRLDRLLLSIEKPFARKIYSEKNRFIRQLYNEYLTYGTIEHVEFFSEHKTNMFNIAQVYYEKAVRVFGEQADIGTRSTSINFQLRQVEKEGFESFWKLLTMQYISEFGAKEITRISDTTKVDIRRAIIAGQAEDLGRSGIAEKILATRALSSFRAKTIAATETHNAAMFSNIETTRKLADDFEVETLKEWIPAEDERVREWHSVMRSKPAIPIDEKFIVNGRPMDRPGDPNGGASNVINCRCVLGYKAV